MNNCFKKILFLITFSPLIVFSQKNWSLEECINYAKENNAEIIKQKIRTEIANSNIKISKGNYFPDASFNASQNFTLGNSFNVSTGVGQRESRSNSFSLTSSLPIFNGFSNRYNLEISKLEEQISKAEIEKLRFDLSLNITNRYLQVLFNKEILKVTKEQLNISKQNLNRLEKLYEKALVDKKELLQMQATYAFDEKENLIAENNVENSLIELKELLGINEIMNFNISEILIEDSYSEDFFLNEEIVEKNPLIISSKLNLKLKEENTQLAKANFLPRLNLNYSYSSNYFHILGQEDLVFNQQTNQFEPNGFWVQLNNNRTHFIGISAIIPIFNRFATRENYKKSKEELKISKIELENNKQILRNDIKIAYNDVNTAKASFISCEISLKTQKEVFEITQKLYLLGNIDNYKFLENKQILMRNNSDFIKAKYEYFFKTKILKYYLFK